MTMNNDLAQVFKVKSAYIIDFSSMASQIWVFKANIKEGNMIRKCCDVESKIHNLYKSINTKAALKP